MSNDADIAIDEEFSEGDMGTVATTESGIQSHIKRKEALEKARLAKRTWGQWGRDQIKGELGWAAVMAPAATLTEKWIEGANWEPNVTSIAVASALAYPIVIRASGPVGDGIGYIRGHLSNLVGGDRFREVADRPEARGAFGGVAFATLALAPVIGPDLANLPVNALYDAYEVVSTTAEVIYEGSKAVFNK